MRMEGHNNIQNTLPKIPVIYISMYQQKEVLEEGSIDREVALTQQTEMMHHQDRRPQ